MRTPSVLAAHALLGLSLPMSMSMSTRVREDDVPFSPPDDVEVHPPRATRQVLRELESPKPPTTHPLSLPRNRAERRAAMFGARTTGRRR